MPWLRKLQTELERSLSYHQEEGALLVGHQALGFTFVFLIRCILAVILNVMITMQREGMKADEAYHPGRCLQE